jgi:signal transduction histidine kinase
LLSLEQGSKREKPGFPKLDRLVVYTACISGLGLVILAWSLSRLPSLPPDISLFIGFIGFAELTTSASLQPEILFSIGSAVTFASLLLFGTLPAALVAMIGGLITTLVNDFRGKRQKRPSSSPFLQRALFNMAALGLTVVVAGTVYVLAGGQVGEVGLVSNLLPMILTAAISEFTNAALVIGAVSLQTGKSPLQIWKQSVSWATPMSILSMIVGGGGLALGYQIAGLLGAAIFLLPLTLTIYAFRLYVGRTKAQMAQLEQTIDELQQAQEEIRRQAAYLEALNAVIAAAAAAPDLPQLLKAVLRHALQALRIEKGAIWIGDQLSFEGFPLEMSLTVQKAVRAAEPELSGAIAIADWSQVAAGDALWTIGQQIAICGARASIIVPILSDAERVGGLCVAAPVPRVWSSEETALVEAVGRQLGSAADRVRLLQEVRHHAEELEAAVARLQELDRLKNEFMQNASHELRTPLALIRGYMELMTDGEFGNLPPVQQGILEVVKRQTQVLGNLVEDITLSLTARARSFTTEPVDLNDLVLVGADDFSLTVERAGLSLITDVAPYPTTVLGEPFYLRRVLDNLVSNAIKFTPAGGKITLRLWQEGEQVILQVCDTGIGIPRAEQKRIFERFYQVDGSARRKHGGMGLGLALVREIVEAHGGTVGVESTEGEGSIFSVILPAMHGSTRADLGHAPADLSP